MGFIIADRAVPDTAFTASSTLNAAYAPYKARMDNYLTSECHWSAAGQYIYCDGHLI